MEHVFFDESFLQKDGSYHCFTAAPRNLVTFACRGGLIDDRKKWLSSAVEYQSKTLETMMFYTARDDPELNGSHSAELQKQFENLRCFYLQVASIDEVMKDPDFPGSDIKLGVAFLVRWLQEKLPRSTEIIFCDTFLSPDSGPLLDKTLIQFFDIVLAEFLDSRFPNKLKAVYLNYHFWPQDQMPHFPNLFHAGARRGIDICFEKAAYSTFTKYESYFPRPLEKYDLLTGPFASQPRKVEIFDAEREIFLVTEASGGRVFNPFYGDWDNVGHWFAVAPNATD